MATQLRSARTRREAGRRPDQGVERSRNVGARTALDVRTYTCLPTAAEPHTTTIKVVGGKGTEIDRVRRY